MSGIAHKVEEVAHKHLHSGEPGTTGRENFEVPSNAQGTHQQHSGQHGLGSGLTGNHGNNQGLSGNNAGVGSGLTGNNHGLTGNHNNTTGAGLTGNHGLVNQHDSGLTGNHGLTGNNTHNTGLTGSDNTHNSSGLTGNHGSSSTGTDHSGILGNSKTQDVGSGVPTGGLTGNHGNNNNHGLSSESTARSDLGQTGAHGTDHNNAGKPSMMEKVKDAVGMNKHDNTHNTHDNTHGTHGSHNPTGTGSGLNTLSSGQNTTSTGLTGSSGHSTGQGIGGHDNHATQNTAAALGAGSLAGGNHNSHASGLGHNTGSSHTGTGLGSNSGLGHNTGSDHNRVGELSQDAHRYESTGASGPTTHGAAGTDRFDTGKHHNTTGTGLTGTTDHGLHEGHGREEKGTGGIGGLLTTTDKDFLGNRDRIAKDGAYVDTDKYAQQNTSGPGGNSALTGREGTTSANPVAQAQAHGANVGPNAGHQSGLSHGAAGTGVADVDEHGNPKKKGIVEKIKDAIM